jgi:glycosyltransferase involved in cell wall biosynthesis
MAANHRPKVLTLVSHYLPGFKAGGPIRSVANLVTALGSEFDFRMIARDRDVGDATAYADVRAGKWQQLDGGHARYVRGSAAAPVRIASEMGRIRPDLIYVNSFFDAKWSLSPLAAARFGPTGRTPLIIAPRGQFAEGALQFKPQRKKLYLAAFRSLGLMRDVIWHATSEGEREEIGRAIGRNAAVVIAPNLSGAPASLPKRLPKRPGSLRLVFFSRVSPKKNLRGALEIIASLLGDISLDIWGPIEDRAYEQACRQQIAALPANLDVHWRGPVAPPHVDETLSQYDALLLPTFGENFGHAIVEALGAGCPVVISDRTPWRNLESHGAGWDLPLERENEFRHALQMLCAMGESEHARMRARAAQFSRSAVRNEESVAAHRRLFELALEIGGRLQHHEWRRAA